MQFPFTIQLGSITILWHTIFETLGFFIGFRYFLWLRKQQGDTIQSSNRIWILTGAIFGALFGSRLIGGLENFNALQHASNKWLYFYSNKTVLGGFLGGLAGVELTKKIIGEKHSSGDLFTYPMILALTIGRVGCFSMGIHEETYGSPTTSILGMYLGDNVKRHPVCLYEIAFLLMLWLCLVAFEKRYPLADGARFKIFMIAYCFFRLILDFAKPRYTLVLGLSTIQLTALAGLVYYYRYFIQPSLLAVSYQQSAMSRNTSDL
ncbi:prolipoprotein diacylglyceryl transferase [Danxiaibacter flavus]|uniref:Prolipoprotein diacylglyceryl transferase n=1 Tax=Danxiaibacter flavus TaxID=3049108 RepID=A0ABV3ZLR5_9BACT|nr:prolipoprotein diacylglyceryl transferase [Chitinophagaceae bacterium DXS]